MSRVAVVIEYGAVTGVYRSSADIGVEVIDLDAIDADKLASNRKVVEALYADIAAGKLTECQ